MVKKTRLSATLKRLATPLFYLLVVVFLALYLKSIDTDKLQGAELLPWALALATFFGLLTRYFGAFIWFVILRGLGAKGLKRNKEQLVYVYAKSWLGRYVPGTAPWILGKIYFASRHGIPKNKLAVSSILEAGLQIVVILALSLFALLVDPRFGVVSAPLRALMYLALVVCVLAMVPAVFNKTMSITYKVLKKKNLPDEDKITNSMVLKGASLYAIGALINGLSLFFIAKGVYPDLSYETMLFVISAGNLAGVLGMMAIFVPSGIGVREGVQLVLLSAIMPVEIALLITVTTRLWAVFVDLAFYAATLVHLRISKASA